MKKVLCLSLLMLFVVKAFSQEVSLKEKALEAFKNEHYNKAISLLEDAQKENPNDAEIYYYLGFFNHYRANDSRPLQGYNYAYSEKILGYLSKAIDLNPNYGDAKYFYSAQCGSDACEAMQNYDLEKMRYYYKLAFDMGAFPKWLLEFGRNMLDACDKDAILFTGGDADFNICTYLQLFENFRTDITLIPFGLIDRRWYIKFFKKGLDGGVRKINISLTDNQIEDMHPYKWKTTAVELPFIKEYIKDLQLDKDHKMEWIVEPDMITDRDHTKIEGEAIQKRTYLSPRLAMLLQIIEDNYDKRKIYFSNCADPYFGGGLFDYTRNCGLVSELLPLKTQYCSYKNDYSKIKSLLTQENLKDFASVKENDIPRISGILFLYHQALTILSSHYKFSGNEKELSELQAFFEKNLVINFKAENEEYFKDLLEKDN